MKRYINKALCDWSWLVVLFLAINLTVAAENRQAGPQQTVEQKRLNHHLPTVIKSGKKTVAVSLATNDQIRAALFQLMLHPSPGKGVSFPYYKAPDPQWKVSFLNVNERDPSQELLKSLVNKGFRVKPASASLSLTHSPTFFDYAVKDRQTGESGVILSVHKIQWRNRNRVLVRAGYYSGGRNAGSAVFTLNRKGGIWSITQVADLIVS